ncbi:MAG: hypothetical protein ACFB14_14475 [Leptolyngbyaceae cyanobacterium]
MGVAHPAGISSYPCPLLLVILFPKLSNRGPLYHSSDQIPDIKGERADRNSDEAQFLADGANRPPSKVEVYEQYLRVPHYIVYSRYTQRLRYFKLIGSRYKEQPIQNANPLIWLEDLGFGLSLWGGYFEGLPGPWLRWCEADSSWLLTDTEKAEKRAGRLAARLREMGVNPDEI